MNTEARWGWWWFCRGWCKVMDVETERVRGRTEDVAFCMACWYSSRVRFCSWTSSVKKRDLRKTYTYVQFNQSNRGRKKGPLFHNRKRQLYCTDVTISSSEDVVGSGLLFVSFNQCVLTFTKWYWFRLDVNSVYESYYLPPFRKKGVFFDYHVLVENAW